jgi:signal recognition particle GTPase
VYYRRIGEANKVTEQSNSAGGAATHAGTNYQDYVAAWTAVQILAEQDVSPPWDLPAGVSLETLHAEAPNSIDDLTVETSAGGRSLAQAKHTVTLANAPSSALGSTIAQFVQEFAHAKPGFDPNKDRFVLVTSPQSSGPIKFDLPAVLRRLRTSPHPDQEWTAGSQDQQDAARALREHINREWNALHGVTPSNEEVNALARLIRIHILDVDPGGHDAQHAKDTLRQRILKDPTAADHAWNTLITTTGEYAANHQRADRTALQQALTKATIDLQAQRSYRKDIERLKTHTTVTLDMLQDYARITVGTIDVAIQRAATQDARTAATDGHLLILGDPGAGKSGSLHELAEKARLGGADVVLFAVDQLDAASLGVLRNELGLEHELITILDHWPGTQPGYFVIDALDAARTAGAVRTLHTLIDLIIKRNNRWRVIASVRKFDLRHNPKLQQLFSGTPPSPHTDKEFFATRHVNIPALIDAEFAQVDQQAPELGSAIAAAPAPLRELLRLPFNLRLLAELVAAGVSPTTLGPLRTQLDLLDRYWQERIIRNDGHGDGRELVLRRATRAMVQGRALRVRRADVVAGDTTSGPYLTALLSTHILAEWIAPAGLPQHDVLTFPHHLLYDYAVARLAIPADDQGLVALLTAEPDLLLAIRPSIELYFQRRWHMDNHAFWALTLSVIAAPIPEVGKLIAPSVAALHAKIPEQAQPLLACIQDPAQHELGIVAFRHVLATLLTRGRHTSTPVIGPWLAVVERASEHLTPSLAETLRPFTIFLTEPTSQLDPADQQLFGHVARRLLAYGLQQGYWLLTVNAINAVTATITTDAPATIALLRECITPGHLNALGYRTLSALAHKIPTLAATDPSFGRDTYIAAFAYRDTSTEGTSMGDSQILPMRSHRKQDYDGGLYQLVEHYPAFLAHSPTEAIDALLPVIDAYVQAEHRPDSAPDPVFLDGEETTLLQDYSSIWDRSGSHDQLQMLDALQDFLEAASDLHALQQYIRQIVTNRPPAVVWRRLLTAGAHQPATVGHAIRALTWDPTILTAYDTTEPVGHLLKTISTTFTPEERERVENGIMGLPHRDGVNVEAANEYRDRLLGCLDPTALTTAAAQERYQEMLQAGGPPANEERPLIAQWGSANFGNDTVDSAVGQLLDPVRAFGSQFLNMTPSTEAIAKILPAMRTLNDAIASANPAVRDDALTRLALCAVAIARTDVLTDEQAGILLPIVVAASKHDDPGASTGDDPGPPVKGQIDARRSTGAEAITALARHSSCCTKDTREAIRRLSTDPSRTVRAEVAAKVLALFITDQEFMWELIGQWGTQEQEPTVLDRVVHELHRLPTSMAHKTVPVTITIFNRTPDDEDGSRIREGCVHTWVGLVMWANDDASRAMLDQLIASPAAHAHDLQRAIIALEGYLPSKEPRVTTAAFALLLQIITSVTGAIRTIEETNHASNPWPRDAQEAYGDLVKCADTLAQRLYFASGAFKNPGHERPLLPADQFYAHAKPLFDLLAPIGHPHTTQYLVDTLRRFIEFDAAGVLLLIGDAITAGGKYGYAYEQLAEGLMVKLVERYLAEFRPLLRERPECHTALMKILDGFVRVGWPSAHQLTYQLSDIYR